MFKKKVPLTRAEMARKRRAQNKRSSKRRMRNEPLAGGNRMPPVLMRGAHGSVLINNHRKPRKRLAIPLNKSGAEISLPAIPAVKVGWRALSGVIALGSMILLVFFFQSDTFRVRTLQLQGANRLTLENINAVIGVVNRSVFSLEPAVLEKTLKTNIRDLRDVSVRIGFPASVVVLLEERQPVIEWRQEGRTYWIDEDGVRYAPRGDVEALPCVDASGSPTVSRSEASGALGVAAGKSEPAFLSPVMIQAIREIREKIPSEKPLIYDPSYGLGWMDTEGWKVFLGVDVHDFDAKLKVYQALVKYLHDNEEVPYLVDIEYTYAPFIRLEP